MQKIKKIWGALQQLKADKEDTSQVFIILSSLGEGAGARAYKRFLRQRGAAAILDARRDLMAHLCDRDWLSSLPAGSLGRSYYEFTEREQISADGLVQASIDGDSGDKYRDDEMRGRFAARQRDAHDLWHVVTGYGRDPLGELSLLAVTWRQMGNIGILLIIGLGVSTMYKELGLRTLWRVLAEGFRLGRTARWLPSAQWEALMHKPLEQVRAELNITLPQTYRQTLAHYPQILQAV